MTATARFSRWHEKHHREAALAPRYRQLIPLSAPKRGEQFAFVVDLDKCSGCKACVCACHSLNGLDEGETWRSVGLLVGEERSKAVEETPDFPAAYQQHVTTACHHCADPACLNGCPVLAYEKDPVTGIVRHLDDQCIGCQYCVLKCPYDVPKYSAAKGIVRKCDMCHNRLNAGEAPACVQACPHEAIRIEIVDQSTVRTETTRPAAQLLPGAFPSNYTLPTTRYTSTRPFPSDIASADGGRLEKGASHLPLVLMLVLTQAALGLHLLHGVLLALGYTSRLSDLNVAALALLFGGLGASALHLGRPLKAWRAFLGWKHSWMSREIIAFGFYTPCAIALAQFPSVIEISALTMLSGIAAVFASAMIYVHTRRPAWPVAFVFPKFFGAALLLGTTIGAVWAAWMVPHLAAALALIATGIRTMLFGWDKLTARRALSSPKSGLHRSALIARELFHPVLKGRSLLFVASTMFSMLAIGNAGGFATVWGAAACGTTLASQFLERYLFFTTCTGSGMPGGIR
ncbi:MAG TPA: DmsC/YnfH family molybdoenzyme membrane anchor subunit [Verrucomicrobiae bacterium]|nr:DmsC/YnfH family molybdoenzyme membrane anchor subunit [Verrucomicrobiae bacterium]